MKSDQVTVVIMTVTVLLVEPLDVDRLSMRLSPTLLVRNTRKSDMKKRK